MKENSKVTDINVGDMEENIKELKRLLYRDELTQYGKRKLINYYEQQEKDYKRVLKENEDLKNEIMEKDLEIIGKEEYTKASMKEIIAQYYTANEDCIPKSKIKDIINRIDYDIKKTKEIISNNSNIYTSDRKNDYQIVRLRAMNTKSLDIKNRLQELLESEE